MPFALTTSSTVICGHGGTATLSSTSKLTVNGDKVLLESEVSTWAFDVGCSQKNTSNSEVQCATITSLTGGTSSKLSVAGVAVVMDDLAGQTTGAPRNTDLSAASGQSKLEVSS